jgi:hypothetical protein
MPDLDLNPIHDETKGSGLDACTYVPWSEDGRIGYRVERPGYHRNNEQMFIYLNPSDESDDGVPNVFVYMGTTGDPTQDAPLHHYVIDRSQLLRPFIVRTAFGERTWQAEDIAHALEQHENAFGGQTDERVIEIREARDDD